MADILVIVIPWLVTTAALFAFIRWDEGRLPDDELARGWPTASRRLAIVYFGVLALPVHFGRTRRSLLGVLEGLAWAVLATTLDEGLAEGLDALLRWVGLGGAS